MQLRRAAMAALFATLPFAWSCAQSDDSDLNNAATGGSTEKPSGTGGGTGGVGGVAASGAAGQGSSGTGGTVTTDPTGAAGSPGTGGMTSAGVGGSPVTSTGGVSGVKGTGGSRVVSSTGGVSGVKGTGGSPVVSSTGGVKGTGGATVITGTGGTPVVGSSSAGTIVPLYTSPSDPSWSAIITAANAHPTVHVVAIVNPNTGPGSAPSDSYTTGIAALQAAHIVVIGYVGTNYGGNSVSSVEAKIDSWKSFYPTLQGIFFDEQSHDTGEITYYRTISQYAKSKGLSYTVGNPGAAVPTAYVGALDTMLVYESAGLPAMTELSPYSSYPTANFGVIPYATSFDATFVKNARKYVEYIYLQTDNLPNPWNSLTPYFAQLLAALE
jgi:hypothetical protein